MILTETALYGTGSVLDENSYFPARPHPNPVNSFLLYKRKTGNI
jgi:hypothetical protein